MSEAPEFLARFVCYGTLPAGEIWASGFWMSMLAGPADGADWQSTCEAVGTAMFGHAAWFTDQNVAAATWQGVKGYYHASNPAAPAVFAGDEVFGSAKVGDASGDVMPNQVSLVATTQTGQSGRSFRGRMYIPTTNLTITAGFVGSGQVDSVATNLAACLKAARDAEVSRLMVVSIAKNVMTLMTALRVDDKADIQRRRANRIGPTYQNVSSLA